MKTFSLCCNAGYKAKEVISSGKIDLSILPLRWVQKICGTVMILCTSSVAISAGYSCNSLLIFVWPQMGDRCQPSGLSSSLVRYSAIDLKARYSAIDLKAIPTIRFFVIILLPVFPFRWVQEVDVCSQIRAPSLCEHLFYSPEEHGTVSCCNFLVAFFNEIQSQTHSGFRWMLDLQTPFVKADRQPFGCHQPSFLYGFRIRSSSPQEAKYFSAQRVEVHLCGWKSHGNMIVEQDQSGVDQSHSVEGACWWRMWLIFFVLWLLGLFSEGFLAWYLLQFCPALFQDVSCCLVWQILCVGILVSGPETS